MSSQDDLNPLRWKYIFRSEDLDLEHQNPPGQLLFFLILSTTNACMCTALILVDFFYSRLLNVTVTKRSFKCGFRVEVIMFKEIIF